MREGRKLFRRLGFATAFVLAASATQALSQTNPACGVPAALGDGWSIDSPDSVGLDGARLCSIAARLKATDANVHAVVIVRHGKLVFEQYFSGYDERFGQDEGPHDFDATTKHDMRSASKSVINWTQGDAKDQFVAGKAAMMVNGPWQIPALQNLKRRQQLRLKQFGAAAIMRHRR